MNYKELVKKLSIEFDLSPRLVETELSAYWRYIRNQLSNPVSDQLRIPNLGRFIINHQRLFKLLAHYIINLRKLRVITKTWRADDVEEEARTNFPIIWKLKQQLGWHNTSKKKGPKEKLIRFKENYDKKYGNLLHQRTVRPLSERTQEPQ